MRAYAITFAEPQQSGPIILSGPGGVVAEFPHRGCGDSRTRFDDALRNAQVCLAALERPAYHDGSLLRAVLLGTSADNLPLTPLSWLHSMVSACEKPGVPEQLGLDDPASWSEMCAEVRGLVREATRALGLSAALEAIAAEGLAPEVRSQPDAIDRYAQAVLGPSRAEIQGEEISLDQAQLARWHSVSEVQRERAREIARDALLHLTAA